MDKGIAGLLYVNTARLVKFANKLKEGGVWKCKLTNCKLVGKFGKLVFPRFFKSHTLWSGSERLFNSLLPSTGYTLVGKKKKLISDFYTVLVI